MPNFYAIGNRLAVDFGNTVVAPDGSVDGLRSWSDLVEFLIGVGQIDSGKGKQVKALAQGDPDGTEGVVRQAVALRDTVRRIVAALAERRPIQPDCGEPINSVLRVTEGHDELVESAGGWQLAFVRREQRLEWLLAGIARSAAELVAEGPGAPVRKCGNPDCVLYFYDTSRTHRRRWCSMAVCGNRSKVAAFAARRRRAQRKPPRQG